jgi:Rrf2 family protein
VQDPALDRREHQQLDRGAHDEDGRHRRDCLDLRPNACGMLARMQISAKTDYALRALCLLASAGESGPMTASRIAEAQSIPRAFLDQILLDLRRGGMLESRRGPDGGHRLVRPSYAITVADVVRVIDGPLALVHGKRPEDLGYDGPAERLQDVWVAVRAALRAVLERTTLEQIVSGALPPAVTTLADEARSWTSVWPSPTGVPAEHA